MTIKVHAKWVTNEWLYRRWWTSEKQMIIKPHDEWVLISEYQTNG